MRTLVLAAWAALLAAGILAKVCSRDGSDVSHASLEATKELRLNHQLSRGDLVKTERDATEFGQGALIGQYLKVKKSKGDNVALDDVGIAPQLNLSANVEAFVYHLDEENLPAAGLLIPGRFVRLCRSSQNEAQTKVVCSKEALEVLLVHRETEWSTGNWIVLEVSRSSMASLGEFLSADDNFLLISTGSEPPSEDEPAA